MVIAGYCRKIQYNLILIYYIIISIVLVYDQSYLANISIFLFHAPSMDTIQIAFSAKKLTKEIGKYFTFIIFDVYCPLTTHSFVSSIFISYLSKLLIILYNFLNIYFRYLQATFVVVRIVKIFGC